MNIKTILSKPIPVVWYRFVQLIKLKIYTKTNFWYKIEDKVHKKIANTKSPWKEKSGFFSESFSASDIPESLQTIAIDGAKDIMDGKISVFDVSYNFTTPFRWNTDWRADYTWENNYFKTYSFYEQQKTKEYDVKFPWELSRLSFLIPVARAYQIEEKKHQLAYLHEILTDWKTNNSIAYSVNWYAMEVSVRTINLIQLREILLETPDTDTTITILNEILVLHGIFLWRNIEFTDIRGNHYSANLTALLLIGKVFKALYPEANAWYNYALKKIEKECHLQFIEDGVNFEKSIPYHRLVVEFYLISFLVMQRSGVKVSNDTLVKLKKACEFTRDYTKPNLLTPIIGDNDSASVFQNDEVMLNDHTNMLQLASLFFDDGSLNITTKKHYSVFEIFGTEPVKSYKHVKSNEFQSSFYKKGGFVIVKNKQNYFIADIGEVGMKGRGGHGHNDLFSFELMCGQTDIIIDAGCYTYTGDLALKTKMKSTAYHNGLLVDGEEIAPMIGNWGISNVAAPFDVAVENTDSRVTISGKHSGYNRLADPVIHERTFEIQKNDFKLICTDTITCKMTHEIQRHLHFSGNVNLEVNRNGVFATCKGVQYVITTDNSTELKVEDFILSYNYGSKIISKKLTLHSKITGVSTLHFSIEKLHLNE